MIKIDIPIVVEGKYDKIKLSSIIDAVIITTDGFGIFKNEDKKALIKKLAESKGVIILTDSDSAGNIIRSYLKSILKNTNIYTVLLPEIIGKEKRKSSPSKEGLLGVEGMEGKIIIDAFLKQVPQLLENKNNTKTNEEISTAFLMQSGLSGGENSKAKREFLLKELGLPTKISSSTFRQILAKVTTEEEIVKKLENFK